MKKKIMIVVLGVSLSQSLQAESFDDPLLFEERHHVLSDIQIVSEPKKQTLSVLAALKLAPRYVYEAHVKQLGTKFYAFVASFFQNKKRI